MAYCENSPPKAWFPGFIATMAMLIATTGCYTSHVRTPSADASDVHLNRALEAVPTFRYEKVEVPFTNHVDGTGATDLYELRLLEIPSIGENGQKDNLVTAKYFRSIVPGSHPLIIVLPIWGTYTYPPRKVSSSIQRLSDGAAHVLSVQGEHYLADWSGLVAAEDETGIPREVARSGGTPTSDHDRRLQTHRLGRRTSRNRRPPGGARRIQPRRDDRGDHCNPGAEIGSHRAGHGWSAHPFDHCPLHWKAHHERPGKGGDIRLEPGRFRGPGDAHFPTDRPRLLPRPRGPVANPAISRPRATPAFPKTAVTTFGRHWAVPRRSPSTTGTTRPSSPSHRSATTGCAGGSGSSSRRSCCRHRDSFEYLVLSFELSSQASMGDMDVGCWMSDSKSVDVGITELHPPDVKDCVRLSTI